MAEIRNGIASGFSSRYSRPVTISGVEQTPVHQYGELYDSNGKFLTERGTPQLSVGSQYNAYYMPNPTTAKRTSNQQEYVATAPELISRWKRGGAISKEERERVRQWLMRNNGGYYDNFGDDEESFNRALAAYSSGKQASVSTTTSSGGGGGGSAAPREQHPGQNNGKNRYKYLTGGKVFDRATGKMISEFHAKNA